MLEFNVMSLLVRFRGFITLYAYPVALICLFFLSLALRVYQFPTRWGLGSDDSRDAMIGLETLRRGHLPLIGSFSSAGPFVFGPLFYWYIAGTYLLLPSVPTAPWIVTLGFGLALVFLMVAIGRLLGGRRTALLMGLVAAVSPQLVHRSLVLTQHTFVGIATAATLFFLILAWQKKRAFFAFAMGISLGIGISLHYQAINLMVLVLPLLIIPKTTLKTRLFLMVAAGLGSLVPALPLLLWDSNQSFANTRNIMDFFLIGQHRFYVASSWKLFIFSAVPNYWALVVGGVWLIGMALLSGVAALILGRVITTKLARTPLNILGAIFGLLLILNRFYKGERFEGYLIYFAPFILIFTTILLISLIRLNRALGFLVCMVALIGSLMVSVSQAKLSNNRVAEFERNIDILQKTYPDKKFLIHDQDTRPGHISQAMSFLAHNRGLTAPGGYPIGICENCQSYPILVSFEDYKIVDIANATPSQMTQDHWHKANAEDLFDDLITWSERNKLPSPFSLDSYILERLHLKAR